jgi:hypothetical protein
VSESIKVFVIVIEHTWQGEPVGQKVGAAYWNEQAAQDECDRLEAANTFTRAHYVTREVPFPHLLNTLTNDELGDKLVEAGLTFAQARAILGT